MKIGFTGTRSGMTLSQRKRLADEIELLEDSFEFHHGDCVGADYEAANMVHLVNQFSGGRITIVSHPPSFGELRAHFKHNDIEHEPKGYLTRDRDIVNATDFLIACPAQFKPKPRSGTWYTIRHARSAGKPVMIIWPNGKMARWGKVKV